MLTEKLAKQDKSWLRGQKGDRSRLSWWVTVLMWLIGLCAGAAKVYFDYTSIHLLDDSQLCPVFVENFDSLNLNDWTPDIQLGGFGYVSPSFRHSSARLIFSISNNEFEMTTASDKNLFVQNGQLYIHPTLTSDEIGSDAIFNGGSYELGVCVPLFIDRHLISHDIAFRIVQTRPLPRAPSIRILAKNRHPPCTECADQHKELV
jgi:hypothetical protein